MSQTKYLTSLSIDCVIFGFDEGELKILLNKTESGSNTQTWELPGGPVEHIEDLEQVAKNIVEKSTGLGSVFIEQLYAFGGTSRFPGERIISIAYYSLVRMKEYNELEKSDNCKWHSVSKVSFLPASQVKMLEVALSRLENDIKYQPIAFEVLAKKFTLTEMQNLYEVILKTTLDKRNFRKKILSMNLLLKLDDYQRGAPHRAARFFTFNADKYKELKIKGFMFEL